MGTEIEDWRQQIEAVTGPEGDNVARCALEFLGTEHAKRAVDLGWSELELFGMHRGSLKVAAIRADAKGLIPAVVIGAQHTYTIVAIEPDHAVLRTGGGATLRHRRRIPEEKLAIAFWNHPALCGRDAVSRE